MNLKQSIKIFLAEGNPTGLRTLELFNWSGKGYIIPRDRLETTIKREELKTQGVYILIGDELNGQIELYIGESEDISSRLKDHNRNKDFWNIAIVFFSKDGNLNKAHVKFLEEMLIKEINEAGRAISKNGNQPQKTKLSESDEAEMLIFSENIKLILSSIGYVFMKKVSEYEKEESDTYICVGPDANARGMYTTEGLVVFSGSLARKELTESAKSDNHLKIKQEELINSGILEFYNEKQLKFSKDHVFPSPSIASSVVLARSSNGWTSWKREFDNKTLDQIFRSSSI